MATPRDPASTLERFLSDASFKGEVLVARLRIVLCLLALLNMFWMADAATHLANGEPKYWLMTLVLSAAVAFSAAFLRFGTHLPLPLELSVATDGLLAAVTMGAMVLWPAPSFHGLLTLPHNFVFNLAIIASGFRLSGRAVLLSTLLNLGSLGGLLLLEQSTTDQLTPIRSDDYGIFLALAVLSVLVAMAIVRRTRSLLSMGVNAVLDSERARQRLGMYVSEAIADQAMASAELKPGGQRQEVAILFSDLRDFTRYSEGLSPEQLVQELNAYLEAMLNEISAEGGVVDKYIGDAIMVVFGLPHARPDDAARAIRTAIRMQDALTRHNQYRATQGQPPLRQGLGVHFGDVVAGNIGTTERLQYTVMGDTVNIASRLQSATKELGHSILISAEAAQSADTPLHLVGPLQIRGRENPLVVYRVAD